MNNINTSNIKQGVQFLLITFFITYTCWWLLVLFQQIQYGTPIFMVLYLVGGFGPTIAAIIVLFLNKEIKKDYLSRLFKVQMNPFKYVLVISIVAILCVLPVLINSSANYKFLDWYMIFPLFITMIIGGGLEELGWRGILQEVLNTNKWNLLYSSLIIGVIWAFWHLPLFYIPGVYQYQGNFVWFFVNVVGLALILSVIYKMSKSIMLCIIFHALVNASYSMGFDPNKSDELGIIVKSTLPLIVGIVLIVMYWIFRSRINKNRT